jgi:hypothetical protein
VSGEVYVRALLLALEHPNFFRVSVRIDLENRLPPNTHWTPGHRIARYHDLAHDGRHEVAEVHFDAAQASECLKIGKLTRRLIRVLRSGINPRREVVNFRYVVLWKQPIAETLKIEPFVRRALQEPIVQVKAVDIDVRIHVDGPHRATAGFRPPCARRPKPRGGVVFFM